MNCPFCETELVPGQLRSFETLTEHVCYPNMESHPVRRTYVCPNNDCWASTTDTFWNKDGEFYSYADWNLFRGKITSPIGSFQREIDIELGKIK